MTEIKVRVDPAMKEKITSMAKKKKMTQNAFMKLYFGECAHTPVACPFFNFLVLWSSYYKFMDGFMGLGDFYIQTKNFHY